MPTDVIVELPLPPYDDDFPVEYPKTPAPSPELARGSKNSSNIISPQSSRLLSCTLPNEGISIENSKILQISHGLLARQSPPRFSTRKSWTSKQDSTLIAANGYRCPCIRRRLPTESIPPPVKNKKTSPSKSQKQKLPVEKHSNHPSESTL